MHAKVLRKLFLELNNLSVFHLYASHMLYTSSTITARQLTTIDRKYTETNITPNTSKLAIVELSQQGFTAHLTCNGSF